MSLSDEKLFTALAGEAEGRVSEFNAQELANTAWAFAAAYPLEEKLFMTLAREAEVRDLFRRFDTDKSGFCDPAELWTILNQLGVPREPRAEQVLSKYLHGGGLQYSQFVLLLRELGRGWRDVRCAGQAWPLDGQVWPEMWPTGFRTDFWGNLARLAIHRTFIGRMVYTLIGHCHMLY